MHYAARESHVWDSDDSSLHKKIIIRHILQDNSSNMTFTQKWVFIVLSGPIDYMVEDDGILHRKQQWHRI